MLKSQLTIKRRNEIPSNTEILYCEQTIFSSIYKEDDSRFLKWTLKNVETKMK